MEKNVEKIIEKYAAGKRIAVAVSGGEDSMALLHVLSALEKNGMTGKIFVINIDHCIRPASASDSAFVRNYCRKTGVECETRVADIPALVKESRRGVECEAHFARKAIFEEIIASGRADFVATAHHARDNAETVLMHLFRGAGLKGLSGMKICSDGLLRPLLTTSKEEICAYVRKNDIPFVTDETNADTDYDRNFIRHEILPRVRERFPACEEAINRAAFFSAEAEEFIASNLKYDAFAVTPNAVSLSERYLSAPYILEALRKLGQTSDVYSTAVGSVMKLMSSKSCAKADVGDGITAAREYGYVTFYRNPKRKEFAPVDFVLPFSAGELTTPLGNVFVKRAEKPYLPCADGELVFDADKLPAHCVLRTRLDGDRFTPFGGGTRKLKEYLIDKKVPQRMRDKLKLLCCGNEVLAIVGMEIGDGLKVTDGSVNVYNIKAL